jgi:hypothetical protein
MGLFTRLKGISDPVEAEFRIVACSNNSGGAVYENCAMDGVVYGPGFGPVPVHHTSMVTPTAKWPYPGVVLPVTADRAHPERLKIKWDEVPSSRDVARQLAAQEAQQMAASAGQGSQIAGAAAGFPPQYQSMVNDLVARAQAAGATITTPYGTQATDAASRPAPGMPGGGLTPAESAQAIAGGGAALGLQPTVATVLAAHEVPVPAGTPGVAPGGVWDLTLDVTATPGYTTVLRLNFSSPEKRQQVAAVGRQLPVLGDPTHHDRITVDTTRL